MKTIILRCDCCGLPYARIQQGALVVESRHHGDKHTNVVALEALLELCRREPETEVKGSP